VACLPAAVSLLLLEALFMQISGVSLTLTRPHRICLLRVLLGAMPLLQDFPFPSTLGEVTLHPLSQASVFIYSWHGKWAFPPLLWSFPPTATFTSFPAPGCWTCAGTPAFSGQLAYLQFHERFPSALWVPHLLCYMSFLLLLITQFFFLFFPRWESVCPGGYADLAQGCLWEYLVPLSSSCGLLLPKQSGHWRLVVVWEPCWFLHLTWSGNVTRGGVEESKFCLFLVIFPIRCISSISPRFYFRRHTFCFFPLAAILRNLQN
jgi:hypothetical protein